MESYRSPVENLKELVFEAQDVEGFLDRWVEFLCGSFDGVRSSIPSGSGPFVQSLVKTQFSTWEWNIGRSPKYQFRLPIENDHLVFSIVKGLVVEVRWELDTENSALLKNLAGHPFSLERLEQTSLNTLCQQLAELIF